MSSLPPIVIDIYGEGKTEVPDRPSPHKPQDGVLPILVHKFCGQPAQMQVRCYGSLFMMGPGGLGRKLQFAQRQAPHHGSAGVVFVVDSDGHWERKHRELHDARRARGSGVPTAIGVAHPCIEAWLLADADALKRAFNLSKSPQLPSDPESLPPSGDNPNHPKCCLRRIAGKQSGLSAHEKAKIVRKQRCPKSFDPFAEELEQKICPLFR